MTQDTQVKTRWAPVVALAMAMLAVTTEMTVAAVALPSMGAELDVGPSAAAWVLLAYTLPMAAIAIPAGRWVDRVDVRSAFLLALTGVGLASVLTAVAPSFWVLVLGRVLQGVAGSLVLAGYMPIVVAAVAPEQRGRAVGYVMTIMTVGGLAGAPLGGLVAGAFGWRAVFLLKMPLLVAVVLLVLRTVRGDGRGLPLPDRGLLLEAVLLGGAITAVLLAFEDRPWVALVAVALAVLWGRLPASRPVLTLVRQARFARPLVTLLLFAALGGLMFFLVPYFVSDVLGGSPEDVGLALLVFVGGVAALASIGGNLADRHGPWLVGVVGAVVTVAGMATLLLPVDDMWGLVWRLAVIGVGQGLFNAAINTLLMSVAPAGMEGAVGGISGTARMLGTTVGPAVAALVAGLAGNGSTGFRVGVAVLGALAVVGTAVLATGRPRRPVSR
ncbi:MFS transporter [Actinosynnema sp. NPDC047251]|uniref:Permease, MFS-type n=1 Tax=Saccharothrix espanaensis (strain ATCC 51144 / DSM 44229 / JCM 9112 / NBRC 15066 / NRRL 15764) TaxID=1179773 RepID=K0JSG3_SACES|nr:MFS transporter [Saccharothrix espanaensis]CCH28457.1 Permease, MFS-type [Saccharothrix espanaensis DSM 44229]